MNVSLGILLDELWRLRSGRESAIFSLFKTLKEDDYLVLTCWGASANMPVTVVTLDLVNKPQVIAYDRMHAPLFQGTFMPDCENYFQSKLIYRLGQYKLMLAVDRDLQISDRLQEYSLYSLLSALQFIRDYLDSTLCLPSGMRKANLDRYAEESQIDQGSLVRLAKAYPSIRPYLEQAQSE